MKKNYNNSDYPNDPNNNDARKNLTEKQSQKTESAAE